VGDNSPKGLLIPHVVTFSHELATKGFLYGDSLSDGLAAYQVVGGVTAYQADDG
jgi:hypothetical protein